MKTTQHAAFFQHTQCEFFPCHPGADAQRFNCLFCYCPLYTLGPACGGDFRYTEGGVKDCSRCLLPHTEQGYAHVLSRFPELAALAAQKEEEQA